jgi:dihydrodipicolinate synthase/N-acetylneuraminate lyase
MMTLEEARRRLRGAVLPVVTVFREGDRALDLETTGANVQWIIDRGAREGNTVFLAAGSGGDFTMLNLQERKAVIEKICQVAGGRVPVIASAQSNDIREVIELCQWCEGLGVVGVQISGPFYYDGRPDDVIDWMEEVARHTGVGFLVYNNWYTGYNMSLDLIDRLLNIPNSVGVKWSSPNIYTFYDGFRRFGPRAVVVDNNMMPVVPHMLGCRAFVSQLPHFYPERAWKVWELLEAGRYLEAQQTFDEFMVPYWELINRIEAQTAGEGVEVRAAMKAIGLPAGVSRLPSRDAAATPEIAEGFRALMARFGVTA